MIGTDSNKDEHLSPLRNQPYNPASGSFVEAGLPVVDLNLDREGQHAVASHEDPWW